MEFFLRITLDYDSVCLQSVLKHSKIVYASTVAFLKEYCFMGSNFRWDCNESGCSRQSYS